MFSIGDTLGLESDHIHSDSPSVSKSHKTREDYIFVHTDSHREFMDLLLEKRKCLENSIITDEEERRNMWARRKGQDDAHCVHNQNDGCKTSVLYVFTVVYTYVRMYVWLTDYIYLNSSSTTLSSKRPARVNYIIIYCF